jgi:type II secretory pathway pseudopilin PulG
MNAFDLDDRVTAAAVAAAGTVIGALIQLRVAWRKEVSDRARGAPVTKKSRRGPVLAVFLLLIAAGVGGFALSQYFVQQAGRESAAMRGELQAQLAQISATAQRLERASLGDQGSAARTESNRGSKSLSVTTIIGPCRVHATSSSDTMRTCSEQEALRATLCGSVPSTAVVTNTVVFARPEGSSQPWPERRVAPGQDLGHVRFADKFFERTESDQTKLVCTGVWVWDSDQPVSARLDVNYDVAPGGREIAHATVAPVTDAVP